MRASSKNILLYTAYMYKTLKEVAYEHNVSYTTLLANTKKNPNNIHTALGMSYRGDVVCERGYKIPDSNLIVTSVSTDIKYPQAIFVVGHEEYLITRDSVSDDYTLIWGQNSHDRKVLSRNLLTEKEARIFRELLSIFFRHTTPCRIYVTLTS